MTSSVVFGEPANPHAFQSFLESCFSDLYKITINIEQPADMRLMDVAPSLTIKATIHTIPAFPDYWKIANPKLLGKREKEESFNSVEKLMKYPYQWVLGYKAKLYRGQTFSFPSIYLFYGNLSHHIFQQLLLMPDILSVREPVLKKRYNDIANKAIEERGLLLHTRGRENTLRIFEEYLFDKFLILLRHIKENDWKVEACEVTKKGMIINEEIGGRCDVLLSRTKKKEVQKAIIDLKYSGKKYSVLMNDGGDLQLAIYSRIFHPAAAYCPTSYFIIREGNLYTTCADAFRRGHVLRQDEDYAHTYSELLNRMSATIRLRRAELKNGIIEVGEGIATEEIDIFKHDGNDFILPPKSGGCKSSSEYNDYVTFIDTE